MRTSRMAIQAAMKASNPAFTSEDILTLFTMDKKKPRSASLASILSAFVPTLLTAMLFIAVFATIRHRYPKIYAPRTFISTIPEKDRTPKARQSYFDWAHTLWTIPDKFILYHESLDAYLFLRFLRTLIFICVVGVCLTWPILLPTNASGGGTSTELDKISIGNVSDKKKLYAHAILAWLFFSFVMFTVARERLWLIGLRQAWNSAKSNAKRLSSRTVMFLSAPREAMEEGNLRRLFGEDSVRVWPAKSSEKLESLVAERDSLIEKLEVAEISLILNVNKKGKKARRGSIGRIGNDPTYNSLPDSFKQSLRPTHRLKTPPVGKQVDSIDWLRQRIKEKNAKIDELRQSHDSREGHGAEAIFVEFSSLAAAQKAYQQVASSGVFALTPRFTGILPSEVVWKNLRLPPARRISQDGVALTLVILTIIFWFIPIAIVGAISNVSYLVDHVKWLRFLNNLPDVVMGLLTGLVPPLLTSLLSKYVPNIFRYIFKTFGDPTNTSTEIRVLKWYYVFQVVHVFLVTAVASGSAAAIPQIVSEAAENPTSVPMILAKNLPTSSNFFLTYFIVQGLTSSSDNLLNYSDLLSYLFYDRFFDKTPRQKFQIFTSLTGIAWGKVFPKYTNFVIIAISYSCIAPLVLGFAAAGLAMFYVSYRYMLLYTVEPKIDTKGHCYTLALQQILTGVYIAELALIGFFGLRSATGPSVLLIILLVVTVLYDLIMNKYLAPLEKYIPADVTTSPEISGDGDEQTPLLASAEEGEASPQHSHIRSLGHRAHVPEKILDPVARFFQPQIATSHRALKTWLAQDPSFDADSDVPEYSEEQLEKAYLNPAFWSECPLVWLARDEMGVSKAEVRECEREGLRASDEGAWVDERGRVRWNEEGEDGSVPVLGKRVRW
ncbi:DUF221-domain-containing protein [Westerdykella ornata]|uniref:DUF221-domain-containing protein n=1 Tax=Westerdykella ornata TaxID=318751 RepID=A0A6A6JAR9_WESOR|nr:DUF221-domain-containing protein [Westerdykella ornata]KAF2273691.1 DUF221-domain-containing protein [Westerdykella ornata]